MDRTVRVSFPRFDVGVVDLGTVPPVTAAGRREAPAVNGAAPPAPAGTGPAQPTVRAAAPFDFRIANSSLRQPQAPRAGAGRTGVDTR